MGCESLVGVLTGISPQRSVDPAPIPSAEAVLVQTPLDYPRGQPGGSEPTPHRYGPVDSHPVGPLCRARGAPKLMSPMISRGNQHTPHAAASDDLSDQGRGCLARRARTAGLGFTGHVSRDLLVTAGPQIAVCGPAHRGKLLRRLLQAELIKGFGEGFGDVGRVPIFNLVPLQHEHGLAIFEQRH